MHTPYWTYQQQPQHEKRDPILQNPYCNQSGAKQPIMQIFTPKCNEIGVKTICTTELIQITIWGFPPYCCRAEHSSICSPILQMKMGKIVPQCMSLLSSMQEPDWRENSTRFTWLKSLFIKAIIHRRRRGIPICLSNMMPTTFCHHFGENPDSSWTHAC